MDNFRDRTTLLIGKDNIRKIKDAKILLFGLGGVGGYTLEALIRAGAENIDIVDNDLITITNINRQILATTNSIGKLKTEEAISRAKTINPNAKINAYNIFFLPDNDNIDFGQYSFVIDAIDTFTAKYYIIKKCHDLNIKIISCMGTGNKLDATKLTISDIFKTNTCKVAKEVRKFCRHNNISNLPVVYSTEESKNTVISDQGKHSPASISYVPAVAGMLIAQYVINELIKEK